MRGAMAGRVAGGLGFNAYAIRTSKALLFASGATMKKTGQTYEFAVTKSHYTDHRSVMPPVETVPALIRSKATRP